MMVVMCTKYHRVDGGLAAEVVGVMRGEEERMVRKENGHLNTFKREQKGVVPAANNVLMSLSIMRTKFLLATLINFSQ